MGCRAHRFRDDPRCGHCAQSRAEEIADQTAREQTAANDRIAREQAATRDELAAQRSQQAAHASAQRAQQAAHDAAMRDLEAQRIYEARQAQFATWRQTPDGQVYLRWAQEAQRLAANLRQADVVVRRALDDDWASADAACAGQDVTMRAASKVGAVTAAVGLAATVLIAVPVAACLWGVAGGVPAVVLFVLVLLVGSGAAVTAAVKRTARAYTTDRGAVLRAHLGLSGKGSLGEVDYAWTSPPVADVVKTYDDAIAAAPRALPAPERLPALGLPQVTLQVRPDTSTARLLTDYERQRRDYAARAR